MLSAEFPKLESHIQAGIHQANTAAISNAAKVYITAQLLSIIHSVPSSCLSFDDQRWVHKSGPACIKKSKMQQLIV